MTLRARYAFTAIEMIVIIAFIGLVAAILYPMIGRARSQSQLRTCLSNQQQIAESLLAYAQDHRGMLPGDAVSNDDKAWRTGLEGLGAGAFDCPAAFRDGSLQFPEYGFNAFLAGANLNRIKDPARVLLTADANAGVIRTYADIDARRHGGRYHAAFADGHVDDMLPDPAMIIMGDGEQGKFVAFGATGIPVLFKDSTTAKGTSLTVPEGTVVLLTNASKENAVSPLITVTGSYIPPAQGFIPGRTELQLAPGNSCAFTMQCWYDGSATRRVTTQYHFGRTGRQVTITVVAEEQPVVSPVPALPMGTTPAPPAPPVSASPAPPVGGAISTFGY